MRPSASTTSRRREIPPGRFRIVTLARSHLAPPCLQMSDETKEALKSRGIESLFPIQRAVLGPAMEGRDILARAKTGSGKTLAFSLPIIERLLSEDRSNGQPPKRGRRPRVLVMCPTRELAKQVESEIAQCSSMVCATVYGGAPIGGQERALRHGVDIVVGTPGRLMDLMERGSLALSDCRYVVLDECDQMLDMGFREDMDTILEQASGSAAPVPPVPPAHSSCALAAGPPGGPPDPAVLGHDARLGEQGRQDLPQEPHQDRPHWRGQGQLGPHRRDHPGAGLHDPWGGPQAGHGGPHHLLRCVRGTQGQPSSPRPESFVLLSTHQAGGAASASSSATRSASATTWSTPSTPHTRPSSCTETLPRTSARRPSRASAMDPSPSWSPPTSRPAAWTSLTSTWWSTTTCLWCVQQILS